MVLGKRKEREENESEPLPSHGSTLFVSNLPFTATSVDLQTLFSDIAPVRSAFVVTEHGTGVSKGVGYVSFAMKEDADLAYAKFSKEGITLASRKLRVDWAEPKSKHKPGDLSPKKDTKKIAPRPSVPKLPGDPNAIRTIVISGLPSSIDAKQLWKKIRKYEGAEKVEWPHKAEDESEDPAIAHVLFSTPAAANDAVNKLHAHVYKGSLLSVTLKKRLENLAKPVVKSTRDGEETSNKAPTVLAPSHASRLIVRNLPFNITEQDLRAIFLPYGPVYSINIPTVDPPTTAEVKSEGESSTPRQKPRIKGFAFVWMLSKKDAQKALEGCNGMLVRAGAAESLISDKQKKKKQKRLEQKLKASEKGKEPEDEEGDIGQDEGGKVFERIIAVDWVLSKNKWEEEKAKITQKLEQEDETEGIEAEEDVSDGSGSGDDSEVSEDVREKNENLGVHSGEDEINEEDGMSGEESEDQEEPVKPQLPPPDVGTTVFVRNVPFTATEDELRVLFRTFGPLRYTRITMDSESGRSRGTGFVCFWNKEDADKVIEQSDLLRAETTGTAAPPVKKNPFVLPSILTPDPSSSLAQSLVLHGRTLDVVRAVTRDEAGQLKEAGEKARQKADKRNMYLLKEGVILPNSPLAQNLTPADLERRTNSYNARRALLKSNPSLYISRIRLSIRQIPLFVTERALKRLALHSLKAFESEVQAETRDPLTPEELADPIPTNETGNDHEGRPSKKRKQLVTKVKQTKIIRQQERVDPITGKGRSKGYGFIEMHKHSDALRVLRWANCNPGVESLLEQWYKEELEDLLKVEKGKEVKQRDEAKVKRMKDEIQNGPSKKGKASLIVEFSIENIEVIQRRNSRHGPVQPSSDEAIKKRKTARSESPEAVRADVPSPKRKRRISTGGVEKSKKAESKLDPSVGLIIGRKRKERKKRGAKG